MTVSSYFASHHSVLKNLPERWTSNGAILSNCFVWTVIESTLSEKKNFDFDPLEAD